MTVTDTEPVEPGHTMPESHVEAHGHQHPSDRQYVMIALILGVITAAEVGTYFLEDPSTTFLVALLFPMMVAKFAIVCGWFMHLRFDTTLFRRLFVASIALAVGVYMAVFISVQFFGDAAVPVLLILMVLKFATVAAYFMHLRFDSRLFRRLFVTGLVLAALVFVVVLSTFFFGNLDGVTPTVEG